MVRDKNYFSWTGWHTLIFVFLWPWIVYEYINETMRYVLFDDAYMFIRYAGNFLSGFGLSWNQGEPVYGATSLLHLYSFILLKSIFFLVSDETLIKVMNGIYGLLFFYILALAASRFSSCVYLKNKWLVFIFIVVYFLNVTAIGRLNASGMDTSISLFFNAVHAFLLLKIYVQIKNKSSEFVIAPWLLSISGFLAFYARPDNAIVAALAPIVLFFVLHGKQLFIKQTVVFSICFLVLLGIDGIWKFFYFDDFLPLAFYAKKNGFFSGYAGYDFWNTGEYLNVFFKSMLPFFLFLALWSKKDSFGLLLVFLLPVTITFLYFFSITQIMGFDARYYLPFSPYIILPLLIMLPHRIHGSDIRLLFQPFRLSVICILIAISVSVDGKSLLSQGYEQFLMRSDTLYSEEGLWEIEGELTSEDKGTLKHISLMYLMAADFPEGVTMAASEVGQVSVARLSMPILDIVGLQNKTIAHDGFSTNYLFGEGPDVIWFPHTDYTKIRYQILTDTRFLSSYDYYPYVSTFGIAIRKSSQYKRDIRNTVSKFVAGHFPGGIETFRAKPGSRLLALHDRSI